MPWLIGSHSDIRRLNCALWAVAQLDILIIFLYLVFTTQQLKIPQAVEGSFVALKKPSPFCFTSLLLSDREKNLYVLNVVAKVAMPVKIHLSPCCSELLPSQLTFRTIDLVTSIIYTVMKKMEASGVEEGLELTKFSGDRFCEGCVCGKHHRHSFPTDGWRRGKWIGDIIHSDVLGPVSVRSPSGGIYFVIFKDNFSDRIVN